jgi:predicted phage-related endonuclease
MTTKQLKQKALEVMKAREQIRELQAFANERTNEIKAWMDDETYMALDDTILVLTHKVRTSLDRKRLENDFGDLSEYEKQTPYCSLEIKAA